MKKNLNDVIFSKKSGFSLMEMMVVLLIVAIVMAASAPMISKKVSSGTASDNGLPLFADNSGNLLFNIASGGTKTFALGTKSIPKTNPPSLFIKTNNASNPQITLRNAKDEDLHVGYGVNKSISISDNIPASTVKSSIAIGNQTKVEANNAIAIGSGYDSNNPCAANAEKSIAIGHYAYTTNAAKQSIAIGNNSYIGGENGIAIGSRDETASSGQNCTAAQDAIAIGKRARAVGQSSTVIGNNARTEDSDSYGAVAIGTGASAYNSAVAIGSAHAKKGSAVAIGACSNADEAASIAMGASSNAKKLDSIAIGRGTTAGGTGSIAMGESSKADEASSIAIGSAHAMKAYSIAIGSGANAKNANSIAIGSGATAKNENSIAIGSGANAWDNNQIALGTTASTVYIPGDLVVKGNVHLATDKNSRVNVRLHNDFAYNTSIYTDLHYPIVSVGDNVTFDRNGTSLPSGYSDRRLKNVGDVYKGGLAELKKLEFYHYTFKKDKDKTPRVGIMAQDLQKVFPDAVIKGDDGFLRIRLEDMFYAVINAVKELDQRVTALAEQVKSNLDLTAKLQEKVTAQEKQIAELKKQNAEFEKQNADFEKRIAKLEKCYRGK